jgi:hypothetical protein
MRSQRDNLRQIVSEFEFLINRLHSEFQVSRGRTERAFRVLMVELAKKGIKIDLIKAIEQNLKKETLKNKKLEEKQKL